MELRRLEIAEHECPWGEMAQNYRMRYQAAVMRMMWTTDDTARTNAFNEMQRISVLLFGLQPERPARSLKEMIPGL